MGRMKRATSEVYEELKEKAKEVGLETNVKKERERENNNNNNNNTHTHKQNKTKQKQ
jgi:hypothetical protein